MRFVHLSFKGAMVLLQLLLAHSNVDIVTFFKRLYLLKSWTLMNTVHKYIICRICQLSAKILISKLEKFFVFLFSVTVVYSGLKKMCVSESFDEWIPNHLLIKDYVPKETSEFRIFTTTNLR